MVLETHIKLYMTDQIFQKKEFAPKIGKMDQKWAKNMVFWIYWKLFNFYWIYSIMKIYIICLIPAQIPYLEKFCFMRYWPKCSKNFLGGQCGHRTLKLALSQEWIDGMKWFSACLCKFKKAKSYFNDFWVGLVKNGGGHLVHEPQNLLNEFMDWAHFLHADAIIFS